MSLLQYIHSVSGPVSSVSSSIFPSRLTPLYWESIAQLSDQYCSPLGKRFEVPILASRWDTNKIRSQEKAIQSALILWVRELYKDKPDLLGNNINSNPVGYALSHDLSKEETRNLAYQNAVHDWAKRYYIENAESTMGPVNLNSNRIRFLFMNLKGKLPLFQSSIHFQSEIYYFSLAVFQLKSGGCVFGTACAKDSAESLELAAIEVYARYRFFKAVRSGNEQLLDKIEDHRLWYFASEEHLAKQAFDTLKVRSQSRSVWHLNDPVLFDEFISGPWDFNLCRVLFTQTARNSKLDELPL